MNGSMHNGDDTHGVWVRVQKRVAKKERMRMMGENSEL